MSEKRTWRFLVLEGAMVVASVLLALALDSWYAGRQERARAEAAMEAIREEARLNLAELERSLERIRTRSNALDSLGPRLPPGDAFYPHLGDFSGFFTPDLQDAVWQRTIRQAYMSLLPADFVTDAFALYDWNFELLEEKIIDFVLGELAHAPGRARTAYSVAKAITLEDVRFVEDLIRRHRDFLETHGAPEPREGRPAAGSLSTPPASG